MSSPRHHLLSLVVAALALALGLGLGAGPVAEQDADASAARTERLSGTVRDLQAAVAARKASAALDARLLQAMAEPLAAGRLTDRTVLVVATPGARPATVRRVRGSIERSGATVTGVLSLTRTYVDPARAQSPLEDLALRLVPPGVEFPDGSTAIERVGIVLARATVQRPEGDESPSTGTERDAAEVIAGLDELQALTLDGDPGLRAELAVVVSGDAERPESEDAVTGLLAGLDAGSRGVVLAGAGDGSAGPLSWVRTSTDDALAGVSTVDSVGRAPLTPALVLALAEQAQDGSGHYGLGRGARAVLPDPGPQG